VHEMSIVDALLGQVRSELQQSGHQGRVVALDLVVGRMSGVHVESLRFAFELLSPGTVADGAELRVEEPRAECHCESCGARQEIDELVIACGVCGSRDITIRGGQDLVLQSIELED
jgi:hydrogenase nickel incorporation protein HypA/HybF